jgi:GNAT superfamily N-acetyltransferase
MIDIRETQPDDLESIVALLGQLKSSTALHGPVELAEVQKTYREMMRQPRVYRSFVAVEQQHVIGVLSMVLYKTLLHGGGTALINELVVSRSFRSRGVGRKLIERAVADARERGMDEIEVGTEQGNKTARRFYGSVGFDREYVLFGREF